MNAIKLILMVVLISTPLLSQTLFEDTIQSSKSSSLSVNKSGTKPATTIKNASSFRMVSTNLESVIMRGDVHVLYEIPESKAWSTLLFAHVNPQSTFNNETGDLGFLAGRRMYLDSISASMPLFLQGMVGFNHYQSWSLFITLEAGQRFKWRDAIFFDLSLNINRSYSNDALDPMAYLKANVSFKLDRPILKFL